MLRHERLPDGRSDATGVQTIAAAVEIVPDILLTDYALPDVDGLAIARRLKCDVRTAGICI